MFASLAAVASEENFKHLQSPGILYVTLRLVSTTCSSGEWKYFSQSELSVYFSQPPPRWTWQNTADFGKCLIFP